MKETAEKYTCRKGKSAVLIDIETRLTYDDND